MKLADKSKLDALTVCGSHFANSVMRFITSRNSVFSDSDMTKVDARWSIFNGSAFRRCKMILACFNGSCLDNADFTGAVADDSAFIGVSGVKLCAREAVLTRAKFDYSNLSGADFTGASLVDANFRGAYLAGTKFNNAILDGSNFVGAVLDGADFTDATGLDEATFDDDVYESVVGTPVAETIKSKDERRNIGYIAGAPPSPFSGSTFGLKKGAHEATD